MTTRGGQDTCNDFTDDDQCYDDTVAGIMCE